MSDADLEAFIENTGVSCLASSGGAITRERKLKKVAILNMTEVTLYVSFNYRTQNIEGQWHWVSENGYVGATIVKPGRSQTLYRNGSPVLASRMRMSVDGWGEPFNDDTYLNKDLWLLDRPYISPIYLTYIHCITNPGQSGPGTLKRFAKYLIG